MDLETFAYIKDQGWSVDEFPKIDSPNTLVIIFGAPEYIDNQAPIQQLLKAYPLAKICGCSTAGEIMNSSIVDGSLCVAVLKFQTTTVINTSIKIRSVEDSFTAGEKIATHLYKSNLRGIFVLSVGTDVNGSQLIQGLNSVLPDSIIVTGGLAGDGDRFKKTWVICNHLLQTDYITAMGFYGDKIRICHGSRGGWDTFGPSRRITKSKNNVLYEVDNKPVLALYKEYLGELAKGLPATALLFPMAIRQNEEDAKEIVRTILSVDEKTQSMTFAGDMPLGYMAKLMRATFDRLVTGANAAALTAGNNQQSAGPLLAIAISCVGRRLLLGEYTEEETEATLDALPKGTQQIGFYAYGEISPFVAGHCDLHNQTMTITTIAEEK